MASLAIELALKTRVGSSERSKEQRVRRFYVGLEPDAALGDPGLPQLGTVYPGGNQGTLFPMLLDRYDVEVAENGNSYVDCVYTSDRSARIRPIPDKTRAGYQGIEIDFQDTVVDIPTVYAFPLKIPGLNIIESDTPGYETKMYKIAETLTIYQVTVPISAPTTQQMAAIGIQNNRLHMFGNGRIYRYKAGSVKQTEHSTWEASHTWIEDLGTPYPHGFNFDTILLNGTGNYRKIDAAGKYRWYFPSERPNQMIGIASGNPPFADSLTYIRSPYHVLTWYFEDDNKTPYFQQYCPLRFDRNGWQTLPGGLSL